MDKTTKKWRVKIEVIAGPLLPCPLFREKQKRTMPKKRQPRKRFLPDQEGNKYDKIVKENLQKFIPALISKVLKIEVQRTENLPQVKIQTTKEVEPDSLKIIFNDQYPRGCLLQIEFEAKDEKNTDARMLQYVAIEYVKYRLPVEIHLIYLLQGRPKNIKGGIKFNNLTFRYPVYSLDEISFREFIYSEVPEEVILAILASPEDKTPTEVIRLILGRLVQLRGKDTELYKFINQLKILSMLRNLRQETENQIVDMTINEDIVRQIKEDKMYQMGTKQGITKHSIISIINMAKKGFDIAMTAEVLEVTPDFAASILEQYQQKEEIISLLKKRRAKVEKVAAKLNVNPILVEVIQEDMEE